MQRTVFKHRMDGVVPSGGGFAPHVAHVQAFVVRAAVASKPRREERGGGSKTPPFHDSRPHRVLASAPRGSRHRHRLSPPAARARHCARAQQRPAQDRSMTGAALAVIVAATLVQVTRPRRRIFRFAAATDTSVDRASLLPLTTDTAHPPRCASSRRRVRRGRPVTWRRPRRPRTASTRPPRAVTPAATPAAPRGARWTRQPRRC